MKQRLIAMLLNIFGMEYFLDLALKRGDPFLKLRIVDEAFRSASYDGKASTAAAVVELVEQYAGVKLEDRNQMQITHYFKWMQDANHAAIPDNGPTSDVTFAA